MGRVNSYSVCSMAILTFSSNQVRAFLRPFESFVGQFQRFDRYVVALSLKTRSGPLRGPGIEKVPADLFLTCSVEQDHRAVLSLCSRVARHPLTMPVVQIAIRRRAPLERDVRVLRLRGQFPHRRVLAAFAVLRYVDARVETACFMRSEEHTSELQSHSFISY